MDNRAYKADEEEKRRDTPAELFVADTRNVDYPPPPYKTFPNGLVDSDSHPPTKNGCSNFPFSVFFIVGNEFCERFSFYGMRAVLTIYLTSMLGFSDTTGTALFHVFSVICYLSPIAGSILADGYIGKFHTILWVSLLYAAGNIILTAAAFQEETSKLHPGLDFLGLVVIGIGTGGIKPCVASFGGDQFQKGQEKALERFFSIFYFSINAGSMISTFLTPIFRTTKIGRVCEDSCYPLAFGVPAILMIVACVFFALGACWYKKKPPTENVLAQVIKVIYNAIVNKRRFKNIPRNHWLEHYLDTHYCKYDPKCIDSGSCQKEQFVKDIRAFLRLLVMYIPFPFFWMLYDQQGSKWIIQGTEMSGRIVFLTLATFAAIISTITNYIDNVAKSFHNQAVGVIQTLCLIRFRPLRKMGCGGLLAVVAYVVTALIQLKIQPSLPVIPDSDAARLQFINYGSCDVSVSVTSSKETLTHTIHRLPALGDDSSPDQSLYSYNFTVHLASETEQVNWLISPNGSTTCGVSQLSAVGSVKANGKQAYLGIITDSGTGVFNESLKKATNGEGEFKFSLNFLIDGFEDEAAAMILCRPKDYSNIKTIMKTCDQDTDDRDRDHERFFKFDLKTGESTDYIDTNADKKDHKEMLYRAMKPGNYCVFLPLSTKVNRTDQSKCFTTFINNDQGGIYTLTVAGHRSDLDKPEGKIFVSPLYRTSKDNDVNILWQIPQYVIITAGEILFSITGLEFSYSQAPQSMKAVLQAVWLLCIAIGDIIIIFIVELEIFQNQAYVYFLFAGIMLVVMLGFILEAYFYYEYVYYINEDEGDEEEQEQSI